MKVKVALGLSGGVDSAVSAYLLKKQGFDVSCVYLNCFDGDIPGCRGDNDRKDALAVAMHLGLPFQVLDFKKEYQAAVIDYFKKEYLAGRTPNPDVVCNRDIKFGLLLDWCIKNGFEYLATGHYAKLSDTNPRIHANDTNGRNSRHSYGKFASFVSLFRPLDGHKDQTYFLWAVSREKFKRVLFPLGDLLKTEVREIALKIGLPVAKKKDSTGICFVGEVRVEDFLKRLGVKERIGEVVNAGGQIIGVHHGVPFYTIGQRHGFSTDLRSSKNNTEYRMINTEWKERQIRHSEFSIQNSVFSDRPPLYVIEKDIKKNRLIVGFGAETYRDQFTVSQVNWLASKKARPSVGRPGLNKFVCLVRIRHGGELIPCCIEMIGDHSLKIENCPAKQGPALQDKLKISLSEAQRGIAAGQSAVFYSKDGVVLGGGIIQA